MSHEQQDRPDGESTPWWARSSGDVWSQPGTSGDHPTTPSTDAPRSTETPHDLDAPRADVPRSVDAPRADVPRSVDAAPAWSGASAFGQPAGPSYSGTGDRQPPGTSYAPTTRTPWESDPWAGPEALDTLGSPPSRSSRGRTALLAALALLTALVIGVAGGATGFLLAQRDGSAGTLDGSGLRPQPTRAEQRPEGSIADVASDVLPSVVQIKVKTAQGGGTGSGFVVDANGLVVTNNHVVDQAEGDVTVSFTDGRSADAQVVGRSASYDLAVLRLDATNLPALQLGDSDAVAVGDPVIAIGSPLGLSGTVTSGIVSAKDRPVTAGASSGDAAYINAIQTDAAINPGNSGGPLVNLSGEVIGVNSAIATVGGSLGESGNIGVGFAIPINQVRRTVNQIIETGSAEFPIMGASLDSRYDGPGAQISQTPSPDGTPPIQPGGPADRAGLEPGDVILEIDGKAVEGSSELIVAIRSRQPGDEVVLLIRRNGSEREVPVVLSSTEG